MQKRNLRSSPSKHMDIVDDEQEGKIKLVVAKRVDLFPIEWATPSKRSEKRQAGAGGTLVGLCSKRFF